MGFKTIIQSVSPSTAVSKQLRVCAALQVTLTQLTVTQHEKKRWCVDGILVPVHKCINASYYKKCVLTNFGLVPLSGKSQVKSQGIWENMAPWKLIETLCLKLFKWCISISPSTTCFRPRHLSGNQREFECVGVAASKKAGEMWGFRYLHQEIWNAKEMPITKTAQSHHCVRRLTGSSFGCTANICEMKFS